ncbi:YcgN family cysteine cluster protein [Pseudothioclava nitratireducens]|uniref:YcgN family cysteine cluster protein n=1 Tax=Pseudothioclava nitratireducens TaxID=1928646 RepID=UPI0023DC8FC2|nr:YcgN family cysteine cluster protein [Defluviimonas nitratireducens]MDF1621029.1 YcgN family cysteine cluster protein [Defluviimonas nitratireducens]
MSALRPKFWELPLAELTPAEWEALCDGCGKCCLNKLEYEDTGELAFTRVACKLLDGEACRCLKYETRHKYVPECVSLSPRNIDDIAYWMPETCAYRLRFDGEKLPEWHYLISGSHESVHEAGESVRGWTVSEAEIPEEDWEDYIIPPLT